MKKGIKSGMLHISTKNLVEELSNREGVEKITAEPYKDFRINVDGNNNILNVGPAIILVVMD